MAKTSGLAIAALILGIVSVLFGWIPYFGWFLAIIGVVLGIIALMKISKSTEIKGKGLSITGIILSGIAIVVYVILFFTIINPLLSEFLSTSTSLESATIKITGTNQVPNVLVGTLNVYVDVNNTGNYSLITPTFTYKVFDSENNVVCSSNYEISKDLAVLASQETGKATIEIKNCGFEQNQHCFLNQTLYT
jgi:uncharacterized membrane protein